MKVSVWNKKKLSPKIAWQTYMKWTVVFGVWLSTENNLFSRKQLCFWRKKVILAKLLIINAQNYLQCDLSKVLQNTLTYQIWNRFDKKWWFCNSFLYFVFIEPQQNDMAKIAKCFTDEVNLFVFVQSKVKYIPSSNIPLVGDQIWRIFITFSNVRHVAFTKYKKVLQTHHFLSDWNQIW